MPSSKNVAISKQHDETKSNDELNLKVIKYSIRDSIKISVVSLLPGWFIVFNVFNVNLDTIPESLRLFVKILISIDVGIVFLGISLSIIFINRCMYNVIIPKKSTCDHKIMTLFCVCITNFSLGYVGYCLLYNLCKVNVETLDTPYKQCVILVSSLMSGWILNIIGAMISMKYCFTREERKNIYELLKEKCFDFENKTITKKEIIADDVEVGAENVEIIADDVEVVAENVEVVIVDVENS